ncbi:MAG: NAD(+)/NADH kinase, partial [Coriobacteriia bacterium]|nr:NAD(+)/NADH kinase [Coriobacteriia bacterium]
MPTANWESDVRVLLVPNLANERAVAAASEIAGWLVGEGFDTVLADEDAVGCGMPELGIPASEIGEPGLVVSLGGDGTILKAVHLLGQTSVPILGVNYGRRGFMTGASPDSLQDSVATALAGEGRVERRATLEASVVMDGREVGRYRALNEVFVGRGGTGRVIDVELSVSGVVLMR